MVLNECVLKEWRKASSEIGIASRSYLYHSTCAFGGPSDYSLHAKRRRETWPFEISAVDVVNVQLEYHLNLNITNLVADIGLSRHY